MKAVRSLLLVAMLCLSAMCGLTLAVDSTGLVGHWELDEGSGTTAYDSAGSNHGTVYGAEWTIGQVRGALSFDGFDDYVRVNDDPTLDGMNALTLTAWVQTARTDAAAYVVNKYFHNDGNAWTDSFYLRLDNAGLVDFGYNPGDAYVIKISSTSISDNSWYHIAGVYTGLKGSIYIEGNEVALSRDDPDPGGAINDSDEDLLMGCANDAGDLGYFFNGTIDDMRIYNRALSPEEIQQIYEEGLPEPSGVYYVDGVNGSDLNNGSSLETAFATIQMGIDTANDGNTVLVYPAVYNEAIDYKGKAITVQGVATTASVPTIETPDDFAVSFYTAEEPNSVLKNFVIRGSFLAVFIAGASPTISNLTVVDNKSGVEAYASSEPNISNCIFYNNTDGDLFQCQARYTWTQDGTVPVEEGLVSYWNFDEGTGTTAYDSAGDNGGTIYGATWTTGVLGGALDFNGDDGVYVEPSAGEASPLNMYNTDLTISSWVKIRGTTETAVVARAKPLHIAYLLGVKANKAYANTYRSGHWYLFTEEILGTDSWYHIVGVFERSADTGRIYVNGVKEAEGPMTTDSLSNDAITKIGCRKDTTDKAFDGIIDEVRLYDRALSAEEIDLIYQGAFGGGADPLFADAGSGDYHLKSERGRYWPEHDVWVLDDATSPCVDGGDPAVEPSGERMPNGGRINMGAYGGTPYASMSEWTIAGDINQDGVVDFRDFAIIAESWLEAAAWVQ
jgi:parallel beta-helix repeat protein